MNQCTCNPPAPPHDPSCSQVDDTNLSDGEKAVKWFMEAKRYSDAAAHWKGVADEAHLTIERLERQLEDAMEQG